MMHVLRQEGVDGGEHDNGDADVGRTSQPAIETTPDREAQRREVLPFGIYELAAIHLGAGDDPATWRKQGVIATIWRRIFGTARRNALADPRLETLRRTAMLSREPGLLTDIDHRMFIEQGFSEYQLSVIEKIASRRRDRGSGSY